MSSEHDGPPRGRPDTERPERRRRQLFGRRQGKRLRTAQARTLSDLLPVVAVFPPDRSTPTIGSSTEPAIDLDGLFSGLTGPLTLEVGFGAGEHLAARAEQTPNGRFIGCEPFVNGAAKLLRRIETGELQNIRVHNGDAREVLDALPDASVTRVFVLYPDPWPKTRHWKRRFVQVETLQALARVMEPGATLHVATDISGYAAYALWQAARVPDLFWWTAECEADWRTPDPDWPGTRYEAKAIAAGRRPIYLRFRRC